MFDNGLPEQLHENLYQCRLQQIGYGVRKLGENRLHNFQTHLKTHVEVKRPFCLFAFEILYSESEMHWLKLMNKPNDKIPVYTQPSDQCNIYKVQLLLSSS